MGTADAGIEESFKKTQTPAQEKPSYGEKLLQICPEAKTMVHVCNHYDYMLIFSPL